MCHIATECLQPEVFIPYVVYAGCTFSRPILVSTESCRTGTHPAIKGAASAAARTATGAVNRAGGCSVQWCQ